MVVAADPPPTQPLPRPINERSALHFSGGLALGYIDSEFSYREEALLGGKPIGSASGSGHKSDILVGGYIGADLSYMFNRRWGVFGGAQYQYFNTFKQKVHGREATLDFSSAVYVRAGVSFEF